MSTIVMLNRYTDKIRVIDSHTGGEPTRVVISGTVHPSGTTMSAKRSSFAAELDWIRTATVCEPRGHDAMVGALLCEPCEPDCVAGVIFFNNVGVLNGCLHGTMGVAVTLQYLQKIQPGTHRIDTPTGVVAVSVQEDGATVIVDNVRSYRSASAVGVEVAGYGEILGDVAWGGNWFFLTDPPEGLPVEVDRIDDLTDFAWNLRRALSAAGITGDNGGEIDHIEVFGPPSDPDLADARNFVLCPGKAYDRCPCGTGTSAKLACLAADGKLAPGQSWRQAGILDSVFTGKIAPVGDSLRDGVFPTVSGSAFITGEADLIVDSTDPFARGISRRIDS